MDNLWSDADAERLVADYVGRGVNADLAIRTYSSRLLGAVPRLVMHGGGNTSVKTTMPDLFGDMIEVLCVKGSGRDLGTIEPDGHPAVRLQPLIRLRSLDRLSDEDMVNVQRQNLLDTTAPNPSVETLLHAYLPHKFIDHTHSIASTAIACLPDAEAACREMFGGRVGFVKYIMPGFALAKEAIAVFARAPHVEGLLLEKHGIFSFAGTARASYDLMIEFVTIIERFIAVRGHEPASLRAVARPWTLLPIETLLPVLRRVLGSHSDPERPHWLLSHRAGGLIDRFTAGQGLSDYGRLGVATPEQVIRIKQQPAILPAPDVRDPDGWAARTDEAVGRFVRDYHAYFERGNARVAGRRTALDPLPRVFAIPGVGIVGVGRTHAEAVISSDVAEAWLEAVVDATRLGGFVSIDEADHFDMEYWSLEQAKLGRAVPKRFVGQAVVVTGGAGAIGVATAKAFIAEGAVVAVLDLDTQRLDAAVRAAGAAAMAVACDVTDPRSVASAFATVTRRFGGVDVVVSNAGAAWSGDMLDLEEAVLRRSFELNFFAHQTVAREAVRIMKCQGMGGVLLFNVSKQAVNPGAGLGAYGTAKAALLALVRQYALEHGKDGIRVNAINADRIRSGLLDGQMIRNRAAARGVTEDDYMAGNLLGVEVRADDVAAAFAASATLLRTTGNVLTVDGGNVSAMLR